MKIIFKTLAAIILIFLIFWVGFLGFLQTQTGRSWTAQRVITWLEYKTDSQIHVDQIDFDFPLTVHLTHLSLAKNQEPWLTIDDLKISCLYAFILKGRLFCSTLQMEGVHILNVPSSTPSASSREWEGAWLPFHITVENIDIQDVYLAPAVIERLSLSQETKEHLQHSHLALHGMVANHPFQQFVAAHLILTIDHELNHQASLSLRIDAENNQLSLALHLNHLSLPYQPAQAHVAFYASAPLKTWQTITSQKLPSEQPIEGHFKVLLNSTNSDSLMNSLIGTTTFLKSKYLIYSPEHIQLTDMRLDSPQILLEGETRLTTRGEIQDGKFTGQINHLERFEPWIGESIEGALSFQGTINGPIKRPSVVFHLESPLLAWLDQSVDDVRLDLQTVSQNDHLVGSLSGSFNHLQFPWQIATSFDVMNRQQIQFSPLRLDAQHTRLEGELNLSLIDYIAEGYLRAYIGDLLDFASFTGEVVKGDAAADIRLSAVNDTQLKRRQAFNIDLTTHDVEWKEGKVGDLDLNIRGHSLDDNNNLLQIHSHIKSKRIQWQDIVCGACDLEATYPFNVSERLIPEIIAEGLIQDLAFDETSVKQATCLVKMQNPFQERAGDVQWTLKQVKQEQLEITELAGMTQIHANQEASLFQIHGQGLWKEKWTMAMQGAWQKTSEYFMVHLEDFNGRLGPYPLKLYQPVTWSQSNQHTTLTPLHISWGEAEFKLDYQQNQTQVSGHLQTNQWPSELFHFVAPNLPVTGRIAIEGEISGTPDQPVAKSVIHLHKMQITEDVLTRKPFIEGDLFLTSNSKNTFLQSELHGIGRSPLILSGHLPITFRLHPFNIKVDRQSSVDLAVNVEGDLDPFLQLMTNDSSNLTAQIKVALRIKGKIDAPQIEGYADLTNGFYETTNTGAIYRDIQGRLEGNGSQIILKNFSAQDNKSGTITGSGQINVDTKQNFPFKIDIQLKQIFVVDADYAKMDVSGPLSLVGNMKQPKLQGTLTVNEAVIYMEEALPTQVKTVDVKYINLPKGEALAPHLVKADKHSPIELDIKLDVPGTLAIKGSKITSEWKGLLNVTGTPDGLLFNGDLRIVKGDFTITGKVFNLSQGTIHFAGSPGKKTSLYVVASKDIDRIKAEIIVKGPITKPAVTFRSNPPLSQREILSYILFNRGISDITSNQGDQLNQSFIELSTNRQTSNSDDFLTRMRNNVGIDRLDLTRGDANNNDFSLQVGKYIKDSIFVSFNRSINAATEANRVAIEANIIKNVKAQAEVGINADSPARMSLKWHREY